MICRKGVWRVIVCALISQLSSALCQTLPTCSLEYLGPCKMRLNNSPKVYGFNTAKPLSSEAERKWHDTFYLKYGDTCPNCAVAFHVHSNAVSQVDYEELYKAIRSRLIDAGEHIAFSGLSSNELLVTTVPKANRALTSYYQILVVTDCLPQGRAPEYACEVFGSANIIRDLEKSSQNSGTDDLCEALEKHFADYFFQLMAKVAPSPPKRRTILVK